MSNVEHWLVFIDLVMMYKPLNSVQTPSRYKNEYIQTKKTYLFYDRSVAVCRGNRCEIYTCPSADRQFNLFTLKFVLRSFHDKTTCINWTSDSRYVWKSKKQNITFVFLSVLAVGSADMTTQVFSVPLLDKLHRFTLAGHGREIVGAFFEQDSLNVCRSLYIQ